MTSRRSSPVMFDRCPVEAMQPLLCHSTCGSAPPEATRRARVTPGAWNRRPRRGLLGLIPLPLARHRRAIGPGTVSLDIHHLARMTQRFVGKTVAEPVTHHAMQGG